MPIGPPRSNYLERTLLRKLGQSCKLFFEANPHLSREHRHRDSLHYVLFVDPVAAPAPLEIPLVHDRARVGYSSGGAQKDRDSILFRYLQRRSRHVVAFLAVRGLQHRESWRTWPKGDCPARSAMSACPGRPPKQSTCRRLLRGMQRSSADRARHSGQRASSR